MKKISSAAEVRPCGEAALGHSEAESFSYTAVNNSPTSRLPGPLPRRHHTHPPCHPRTTPRPRPSRLSIPLCSQGSPRRCPQRCPICLRCGPPGYPSPARPCRGTPLPHQPMLVSTRPVIGNRWGDGVMGHGAYLFARPVGCVFGEILRALFEVLLLVLPAVIFTTQD